MSKRVFFSKPDRCNPSDHTVVLLINLGTPDTLTQSGIRLFLSRFLSDTRVVSIPPPFWWPILYGIIVPLRPRKMLRSYRKIWLHGQSPLLYHTVQLAQKMQQRLQQECPHPLKVLPTMTYSQPLLKKTVQQILKQGCRHLIALPLYPQYSSTTTAPCFDLIACEYLKALVQPKLTLIADYHVFPDFIDAVCARIAAHRNAHAQKRALLFSMHGLPQRLNKAGDPYYRQCLDTTAAIAAKLDLAQDQWHVSFQSRFGAEKWLQPSTDDRLKKLAQHPHGIDVCCPGFATDCLETLEEINVEARETWTAAGGQSFDYIPCLNSGEDHARALSKLILAQGLSQGSSQSDAHNPVAQNIVSPT